MYSEANKLYGMSTPDVGYSHPFMNLIIVSLARNLAHLSSEVSVDMGHAGPAYRDGLLLTNFSGSSNNDASITTSTIG